MAAWDSRRGIPGYSGFLPNDSDTPGIEQPASSPYRVAVSRVGFRSWRGGLAVMTLIVMQVLQLHIERGLSALTLRCML